MNSNASLEESAFSRELLLVGKEGLERLHNSCVAVIGLGGVGAYAAEMLARAGVGRLIICDSDVINTSNINRQLLALCSTIGRPKVDLMKQRLEDINPSLQVVTMGDYLTPDNISDILLKTSEECPVDFLVDAIDTLAPKIALIDYCMQHHLPLVSSMGSGAKYDASKVRITDISKSFNCPLAYILRKKLRKIGISKGFKVVFSEELPEKEAIIPIEDEPNKKSQVGTISYLPPVFGCLCAQAAIEYLLLKL